VRAATAATGTRKPTLPSLSVCPQSPAGTARILPVWPYPPACYRNAAARIAATSTSDGRRLRLSHFEKPPCVLLLLHRIRPLCYRYAAGVTGCHLRGCVMEDLSWTICRGSVVRIPSAPITGNAGVKTCRYAVAMAQTNSGGCSAAGPARCDSPSAKGRRCSARPCQRRKSARSWSTSPKAAACAKPGAWWASIGTR
jgi:hypothetical protein